MAVSRYCMTSTNGLQAFVRGPRLVRTTPEWDACEVEWWDTNASLIERIWGLPEPLCRGARKRYIEDIKYRYFWSLNRRGRSRILEVACGSGWPGRLLASPELKVTGVDFSEGQIRDRAGEGHRDGQSQLRLFADGHQSDGRLLQIQSI